MKIEVWSDIACPWCYIGKRRLDTALSGFAHASDVEVVWRSFQLDPDAPRVSDMNLNDILSKKHGFPPAQAVAMNEQMRQLGAREGLTYRFDIARYGNSFDAHRLVHLARQHGLQSAMEDRLFAAYFGEGKAIGDQDTLLALSLEAGLPEAEVRELLAGNAFADQVRADTEEARRLNVRGVPLVVIDEKYALPGAQSVKVINDALRQAWTEAHAIKTLAVAADADGYCEGDDCKLPS
jgi:predicted DsbA family dithiol-disulfide isomerase